MISIAETDPPLHSLSLSASLVRGLPRSYAILFFSANARLGWWLMAISMLAPDYGLSGIAGVCAAGALAWWLGYDRAQIRSGFLLFNPLLVCLTLAYLNRCYHFPAGTLVLLWVASVLGSFFLSAAMQQWVGAHLGLSAHSLPAVTAAYVLYFLGFAIFGPPVPSAGSTMAWLDALPLPPFLEGMFQAFGAMLFQPHVVPGILVFAGLLLASPLTTLVASIAFTVGTLTMGQLGFPVGPEGVTWCGFNFLLCGIALGSGYFIISGASLLLAASGAFLCSLVSLALATALRYFSLPASALSYNLVVLAMVYALRARRTAGLLHPSPSPGSLPESAARLELISARRFPDLKTPALFLPFDGPRVVTQSFNGALTHRGAWSCALDFEEERDGVRHSGAGAVLTDYFMFDTPVFAPCAGVVANVVNQIPDNAPGGNNPEENWGNFVVIFSDAGYYVLLAHMKQFSAAVFIGQRVARGTLLGSCGNSGRSPMPHLHMQIQDSVFPGAPTRPFCLKHYVSISENGDAEYCTSGVPAADARVRPAAPNSALAETLYGWLPGEYRYRITGENGAAHEETLLLDFDEAGRYRLRSRRTHARLTAFLSEGVFYTTNFEGDDRSLLALIATGLARVPCASDANLIWRDQAGIAPFFTGPVRWMRNFLEPFFGPWLLSYTYRLTQEDAGFIVRAAVDAKEKGAAPPNAPRETTSWLARRRGVVRLEARLHNDQVLVAELLDYQPLA